MERTLSEWLTEKFSLSQTKFSSLGGGSINIAFRIDSSNGKYFCKINSAEKLPDLFDKEKNGLSFLHSTKTIKVPEVYFCEEHKGNQVLVLEWIEQGMSTEKFWKNFGEQLANLHLWSHRDHFTGMPDHEGQARFGFHEDNYMGALHQENVWKKNWTEFFIHCRLEPQLALASQSQLIHTKEIAQCHSLYKKLEDIFSIEQPAALHGDLWNGNYLCGINATPVLIDPAVYYGHRCIDLGMTKLFGGFDQAFYEAYDYYYPLPKNFEEQADVCNLYPLLVHLNLFGSGYRSSISSILRRYS